VSTVFLGSLDAQSARGRDIVIWEKDWYKRLVREQSEVELIKKRLLTEDEVFEYLLLFGNQLDYTVGSPLLKSRASSSLMA
jgi:hypothetical protein